MQRILPAGTNPVGFGTGGFVCDVSRRDSLRLLETAVDSGITYFDTARMYGFGEAESIVGDVLRGRRDRFIVASKAGIIAENRSLRQRALNRSVALLHRLAPRSAAAVPTPRAAHPQFGMFAVADIRSSLETSLRKLRTDYLDIFLLHEIKEADTENPELLNFLEGLQREGKVRAFGLATGIEETIGIARTHPAFAGVLQIPSSPWDRNIERLPALARGRTITHSALTRRFHAFAARLATNAALGQKFKTAVQIDPADKAALAQLVLAHALQANPDGVVLFFSSKPENIRASARAATIRPDAAQCQALRALVAADVQS